MSKGGRPTREQALTHDEEAECVRNLHVRDGLPMRTVADALGISRESAYRRLERWRRNQRKAEREQALQKQEREQARKRFEAHYGCGGVTI